MAGITTAFPASAKQGMMQGQHCFNGSGTATCTTTSGSTRLTAISSLANIAPGCAVSGAGIPANSYVGFIDSAASCYITQQATASASPSLTFVGHGMSMVLLIGTVTGTYGSNTTNYGSGSGSPTNSNVGTDELSTGSGYTQGGVACGGANNTTPTLGGGTTAYTTPAVNPSWTSATFTTSGCVMYNSSNNTLAVYVGSTGSQTVSAGTYTLLMPSNTNTTALLRIA
jgi:hypothetical protein